MAWNPWIRKCPDGIYCWTLNDIIGFKANFKILLSPDCASGAKENWCAVRWPCVLASGQTPLKRSGSGRLSPDCASGEQANWCAVRWPCAQASGQTPLKWSESGRLRPDCASGAKANWCAVRWPCVLASGQTPLKRSGSGPCGTLRSISA